MNAARNSFDWHDDQTQISSDVRICHLVTSVSFRQNFNNCWNAHTNVWCSKVHESVFAQIGRELIRLQHEAF